MVLGKVPQALPLTAHLLCSDCCDPNRRSDSFRTKSVLGFRVDFESACRTALAAPGTIVTEPGFDPSGSPRERTADSVAARRPRSQQLLASGRPSDPRLLERRARPTRYRP